MLAYAAYQDALDVERIVAVVVFLVIAVPVGIFGHRLTQKQSERSLNVRNCRRQVGAGAEMSQPVPRPVATLVRSP